jgi:purine-nucleoside phosphorylase
VIDEAIVNPVKNRRTPRLGPVVVMVSTPADLVRLQETLGSSVPFLKLYNSQLYLPPQGSSLPALAGPMMGAPYAAAILESLIVWGANEIIFFGWCGAISTDLCAGDIIVPTASLSDEGTSRHYGQALGEFIQADASLCHNLETTLKSHAVSVCSGLVWTTDAVFRETRAKVEHLQTAGVLAVEMETSALFAVAAFRQVRMASVLVVSDELGTLTWKPGFRNPRFKEAREIVADAIIELCGQRTQAHTHTT